MPLFVNEALFPGRVGGPTIVGYPLIKRKPRAVRGILRELWSSAISYSQMLKLQVRLYVHAACWYKWGKIKHTCSNMVRSYNIFSQVCCSFSVRVSWKRKVVRTNGRYQQATWQVRWDRMKPLKWALVKSDQIRVECLPGFVSPVEAWFLMLCITRENKEAGTHGIVRYTVQFSPSCRSMTTIAYIASP